MVQEAQSAQTDFLSTMEPLISMRFKEDLAATSISTPLISFALTTNLWKLKFKLLEAKDSVAPTVVAVVSSFLMVTIPSLKSK